MQVIAVCSRTGWPLHLATKPSISLSSALRDMAISWLDLCDRTQPLGPSSLSTTNWSQASSMDTLFCARSAQIPFSRSENSRSGKVNL